MVAPGVDVASSEASLELHRAYGDRVLPTAGLHPHDASKWPQQAERVAELAVDSHAVGEAGLDYYRELSPKRDQIAALRDQIEIAEDLDKPIIIHCRDAFADTFDLLEETGAGPRAVLHCWTGGTRWTRRFLDLGVTFSFAGPVAFETGETIRLGAALVPPERALVETDTPYLAPPPHRGKQNEPAWVAFVGAALATVWGMSAEDVAEVTSSNAAKVFGR